MLVPGAQLSGPNLPTAHWQTKSCWSIGPRTIGPWGPIYLEPSGGIGEKKYEVWLAHFVFNNCALHKLCSTMCNYLFSIIVFCTMCNSLRNVHNVQCTMHNVQLCDGGGSWQNKPLQLPRRVSDPFPPRQDCCAPLEEKKIIFSKIISQKITLPALEETF